MGAVLSTRPAEEKAEEAQKTIDEVLKSFQDKRNLYLDGMQKERGPNAENKTTEVAGGRTVMQYSEIFYTESIGPNSEITKAVGDFFNAADTAIDGKKVNAQHDAISGAKGLIMAAIDGILGSTSIGVREMKTFIVLFLNNSFVRIDYVFFQQNIDVVKYLAAVRSTARLIVAEVAVLPIDMMQPAEISYLLSQAFDLQIYSNPDAGFANLGKLQTNLVQVNVLTRMLQEFLETENSSENDSVGANSITKRSDALVSLSDNVNKVLVSIKTPLPDVPDSRQGNRTSRGINDIQSLTPAQEQEIMDRFHDSKLNAKGFNTLFTSKQKVSASISVDEKANIMELMKNTYINFEEAFEDCFDDGVGYSNAFTLWRNKSKADFAMWWFTFTTVADTTKEPAGTAQDNKDKVVWKDTDSSWSKVGDFDSTLADNILAAALDFLKNNNNPPVTPDGLTTPEGDNTTTDGDTRKLSDFSDRKVRRAIKLNSPVPPPPVTTDGDNTTTNGDNTPTNGDNTTTNGDNTTIDGDNTTTDGDNTTIDGDNTTTDGDNTPTDGDNTPTDGDNTPTNGDNAPTDGDNTTTNGDNTPTDGDDTTTNGDNAPTDGDNTTTNGDNAPTDGDNTPTNGDS
jgi:hypothetical protein